MANRIAGITVEIGGDTTKLSTALKTVNSEIRSTQSQLKDVNHLLKLDPGNTELLAQYTHTKHVYEGYKCCMNKGWDEVARICMTHSYVLMKDEFDYSPETVEEKEIKKFIVSLGEADLYDKLIQMCDALATDYGFVILEKRFVDVTRRYGIMGNYIRGWDITFATKEML